MILLNDFKRMDEEVHDELMVACGRVFKSGWYILGTEVQRFESELAIHVGAKFAVGCGNGMDAIEIGLRATGINDGDKVITTPLTAFATSLAIVRAGGVPVYVDVDDCGLVDLDRVERVLQQDPSIHFFVPVHLFGIPIDMIRLKHLKRKYNLSIIEDCAQAIGASFARKNVGSVGQMAAVSFYPTKNLGAFGDGGAVWTSSLALQKKSKVLRDYGQSSKYKHAVVGLNSRLDELHAALLRTQLTHHLKMFTKRRREIAQFYYHHISNPEISLLPVPRIACPVWHLFPILVKGSRRDFMSYCEANGVQTGIHYPILSPQQRATVYFKERLSFESFGNAYYFSKHEVSIPINPYMMDKEIERVVQVVNLWRQ